MILGSFFNLFFFHNDALKSWLWCEISLMTVLVRQIHWNSVKSTKAKLIFLLVKKMACFWSFPFTVQAKFRFKNFLFSSLRVLDDRRINLVGPSFHLQVCCTYAGYFSSSSPLMDITLHSSFKFVFFIKRLCFFCYFDVCELRSIVLSRFSQSFCNPSTWQN